MTDYGEEQRNELEALESIYPDSFTGGASAAAARQPPWGGVGWVGAAAALGVPGRDGEGHSEAPWPSRPPLAQLLPKHSGTCE